MTASQGFGCLTRAARVRASFCISYRLDVLTGLFDGFCQVFQLSGCEKLRKVKVIIE